MKTPLTFAQIGPGDRVTVITPQQQTKTGTAIMYNPKYNCWVLNCGGQHGVPGIVDSENFISATRAKNRDNFENGKRTR